jgi:hypothetical protein
MLTAIFAASLAAADVSFEEQPGYTFVGPLLLMACPLAILILLLILLIPTLLANAQQRRKSYAYMDASTRQNEKTLELLQEIRGELRQMNEHLTRIALGGQQDTAVQPTDLTARRPAR